MGLGTFTPPVGAGKATPFDPRTNHGKPLIVVLREFKPDFVTPKYPTPKDVVICDVVDILADKVYVSVIWGAAAVVDRLSKSTVGEKLPVQLHKVTPASGGNEYATVIPLEGTALELAVKWDEKYPTRIDDERDAHVNAAKESAEGGSSAPAAAIPAAVNDDALAAAIKALG